MFDVAILGAGPVGAAVAHRLAERGRFRQIVLVDSAADVASGLALDIQQSGPISPFETRLSASSDVLAAVGAHVIVVADTTDGEWGHDEGVGVVERLLRAGATGPIVFAGPTGHHVMETCYRDLGLSRDRMVGTAPSALIGTVRSLTALELGLSSVDLVLVGRPPGFVVGWTTASVSGALVSDRLAAHQLLAISNAVPRLWPPGPRSIGSATAPVVEALGFGSRRLYPALTILEGELGARGVAVMLPLHLGQGRVQSRVMPSLSDQERTALLNGLGR